VHTVSFPNVQVNVPEYKADFAVAMDSGFDVPLFHTTADLGPASFFKVRIIPGPFEISFPFFVLQPAGTSMDAIAAFVSAELDSSPALGNPAFAWDPFTENFIFELDPGYFAQFDPVDSAFGNTRFISDFFGIPYEGVALTPSVYNMGVPKYYTPWTIVSVPPAQYSAEDLAVALQAQMDIAFPTAGFEIALINKDTNPRYSIISDTPLKYYSEYSSNGESSLSRVLGISQDSDFNTAFITQTFPNLRGLTVVSLQSRTIATARCVQAATPFLQEESISLSTVTEIPVTVDWLGWQDYRPVLNQAIQYDNPVSLTSISFTLRDATAQRGHLIEMSEPGAHILLEVTIG